MTCHGYDRAYTHPEVRIGWWPLRAVRETRIVTASLEGRTLKILQPGAGLGRQSVRNPRGLLAPSPRPAVVGADGYSYVWCYSRAGTITGWVRRQDVEVDPDSLSKPPLLGPGGLDFECDRTTPRIKLPSGCGDVSSRKPLRKVAARDTYLRYSPRGTAFHYLRRGDVVRLILVDGPHGFAFCEVVSVGPGSLCRPGAQGWVTQVSLIPT